jgi:hypothetical protein
MNIIEQESYFDESDDISCMDDYEEKPEFIKLGLPDTCLPTINKIVKTLQENPDFKSIAMAGSLFQWDVDPEYSGKPRHGEITFLSVDNGRNYYAFFSFVNDWTGAEFEVDCSRLVENALKHLQDKENQSIIAP